MSSTNSSSSEDQQPSKKKLKLESDDNSSDAEENIYYFDKETQIRLMDDLDSMDEDYSDDEREITDEELKLYTAAVKASDGFDVPSFPGVSCCCLITPVFLDDYSRESLKPFCVAAMNQYNEDKRTDYEFLRLEKANAQGAQGIRYYLTFVGRIPEVNTTQTFEALVLRGIPENKGDDATEVYFCREKTRPATDV